MFSIDPDANCARNGGCERGSGTVGGVAREVGSESGRGGFEGEGSSRAARRTL